MTENFIEILIDTAKQEPHLEVYTFLFPNGDGKNITSSRLCHDAGLNAGVLAENGIHPGDIVILVFDHGYDVVAAFWGALFLGALPTIYPYFPKNKPPGIYLDQLKRMTKSTGAEAVIAPSRFHDSIQPVFAGPDCHSVFMLPMTDDHYNHFEKFKSPGKYDEPAYIQFSSGTTGHPKGVLLSHAALIHYMNITKDSLACTPDDVTVGWLPLYHDMGLITQVLHPLFCGQRSVFLDPSDWLAMPHTLFRAVDRYRGSISWMPNFAFSYCTRRILTEQIEGLDLSSWRILGCGSEPVQIEALEAFKKRFIPYRLKAVALKVAYGLAEHVAGVTFTPHDRLPDVDWIRKKELSFRKAIPGNPNETDCIPIMSCGYPKPTVALRIVNESGEDNNDREVGEVLLKSPSLFSGYHLSPEETAKALKGGWLHTGDLGYIAGGQLYIVGRKKDLIITGGNNIQPDYIESIAESVLGNTCRYSAAFGIYNTDLGLELPVLVCEMRQMSDEAAISQFKQQIREQIKDALEVFVADICMVEPGWLIKTTSGKISRSDSREKYLLENKQNKKEFKFELIQGPEPLDLKTIELRLINIWEKLFRMSPIGTEDNFFELGGDSLLAIQMVYEIENSFQFSLPVTRLIETPTISGLTRHVIQYKQSLKNEILVPFHLKRPSSDHPIFFCVHGITGGVLDYRPLALALGDEQPFYAIQAKGLSKNVQTDESIESLAASYIQAIKSVQPFGPFYLGGYCFGGIVAFEMGRQLLAAGEEIRLLAIFDGYPPSFNPKRSKLLNEWLFAFNFLRNLPFWIRDYFQLSKLDRRYKNRRIARVLGKRFTRLMGFDIGLDRHDVVDNASSLAEQYQNVVESNIQAMRNYHIKPFHGRIALFRSLGRIPGQIDKSGRGWRKLAARVDVQMIPGGHKILLKEPNVRILADKLKAYL